MYMSRPQNLESFSLRMRSCRMYFVVGGSGMAGMTLSSVMSIVASRPMVTCAGVLYRLPGARFHCWPSPRSIGSFTTWPSARRNVS